MTAQKDQDAPRRPGRPRGKKPGTANREQLMDIALTLFARDGAGRVSLNAIAVIVDDLIATGGTTEAAIHMIERLGGEVVKVVFLMELEGLKGRERLKDYDVDAVIKYPGK